MSALGRSHPRKAGNSPARLPDCLLVAAIATGAVLAGAAVAVPLPAAACRITILLAHGGDGGAVARRADEVGAERQIGCGEEKYEPHRALQPRRTFGDFVKAIPQGRDVFVESGR